jgi:hypothetical protein
MNNVEKIIHRVLTHGARTSITPTLQVPEIFPPLPLRTPTTSSSPSLAAACPVIELDRSTCGPRNTRPCDGACGIYHKLKSANSADKARKFQPHVSNARHKGISPPVPEYQKGACIKANHFVFDS